QLRSPRGGGSATAPGDFALPGRAGAGDENRERVPSSPGPPSSHAARASPLARPWIIPDRSITGQSTAWATRTRGRVPGIAVGSAAGPEQDGQPALERTHRRDRANPPDGRSRCVGGERRGAGGQRERDLAHEPQSVSARLLGDVARLLDRLELAFEPGDLG